jgi:hypothetical protein
MIVRNALLLALVVLAAVFIIGWRCASASQGKSRLTPMQLAIGFVTDFFDTILERGSSRSEIRTGTTSRSARFRRILAAYCAVRLAHWVTLVAPDNATEIQTVNADAGRHPGHVRASAAAGPTRS